MSVTEERNRNINNWGRYEVNFANPVNTAIAWAPLG